MGRRRRPAPRPGPGASEAPRPCGPPSARPPHTKGTARGRGTGGSPSILIRPTRRGPYRLAAHGAELLVIDELDLRAIDAVAAGRAPGVAQQLELAELGLQGVEDEQPTAE